MELETEFRNPPWFHEQLFGSLSDVEDIGWGKRLTNLPEAWKGSRGAGVKVAVLDTGCQIDHPDLKTQIREAKDFSGSAYGPEDHQGHGTHCAGIIAAINDEHGSIGVAPDIGKAITPNLSDYTTRRTYVERGGLYVGKVLGDNGLGSHGNITNGINWAVDQGVDIISMSLGGGGTSRTMTEAINNAIKNGVFVICAAGNDGTSRNVNYPANLSETIAVAAVGESSVVADYSSRGPEIDIAAPGTKILSTFLNSGYTRLSGTSMATPFVAGVAALIVSKHKIAKHHTGPSTPVSNQDQLREHIARHAIDLGADGYDEETGAGLINPVDMLSDPASRDGKIDLERLAGILSEALSIIEGSSHGESAA
jgi:subtilisin family serine protease